MTTFREQLFKDAEFSDFIKNVLFYVNVTDDIVEKITADLTPFQNAFTTIDFDSQNNYERLEFIGDTKINDVVAQYVERELRHVKNVGWLTKAKHRLISTKTFSIPARFFYFHKHVRSNLREFNTVREHDLAVGGEMPKNERFKHVLEDVFEAFAGAIIISCERVYSHAMAQMLSTQIVDRLVLKSFAATGIDVKKFTYADLWDVKTRVKELYDKMRWPFKSAVEHSSIQNPDGSFAYTVTIYAFPESERSRVAISQVTRPTLRQARDDAFKFALSQLAMKYNIIEEAVGVEYVKSRQN